MNTRQKVLEDALKCVNGEREKQYGNPEDNFRRIAKRWSLYLTELYEDEGVVIELDPIDVARMMIEFKLARANGPKDKLDNYIDMIGYSACAAEIFENGNEDKTDEYSKDPYSYFHNSLVKYASTKAKEKNIPLDNLKSIDRKLPREFSDLLYQAVEDCVSEGKYGGLKLLDCYKEIDKLFEKYKPEIFEKSADSESKMAESRSCSKKASDNIKEFFAKMDEANDSYQYFMEKNFGKEAAAESRSRSKKASDNIMDFFEQVAPGTVTNKEEFEKCCNDYGKSYSYSHDKLANYVAIKAKEEHVPLDNLKSIDHKFPRELEELFDRASKDCAENNKKFLDCYKEIDELFKKYVESSSYRVNLTLLGVLQ